MAAAASPMTSGPASAAELLQSWLVPRLAPPALAWWQAATHAVVAGGDRALNLHVSLASRTLGKAPLRLDEDELAAADACVPGWHPVEWTVDQASRVLLLLLGGGSGQDFVLRLDQLCATADVDELVAFYRGLPLYPDAPRHVPRAAEGLRSSMRVVFDAVALDNPFPAAQFAEGAWNQMVLKALFVGAPLHRVVGLDRRANVPLARMLCDYAHERWAAGRTISPELWRCVGPVADAAMLSDLQRVLCSGEPAEQAGAVLALRDAPQAAAASLLSRHAKLRDAVAAMGINWASIGAFPGLHST